MARQVSARELRNHTAQVVEALRSGERLSLSVNGTPVADIVPHAATRSPWVPSSTLREVIGDAGADTDLLATLAGSEFEGYAGWLNGTLCPFSAAAPSPYRGSHDACSTRSPRKR